MRPVKRFVDAQGVFAAIVRGALVAGALAFVPSAAATPAPRGDKGYGVDRADVGGADGVLIVFDGIGVDDLVLGWGELSAMPAAGTLGGPRGDLHPRALLAFAAGRAVFRKRFSVRDGVGPFYNAFACADCHASPVVGGVGTLPEHVIDVMEPDDLPGETVGRRRLSIPGRPRETAAGRVGRRRTPPLFGLGLLDALPDDVLAAGADPLDKDGDGVKGRLNRRGHGRLTRNARFGAKAHEWDLWRFVGGAMRDEMGVTNGAAAGPQADDDAVADPEVDLATMLRVDAFVRGLAPPPRGPITDEVREGERHFAALGCVSCHRPSLGVAGAAHVDGVYSDLLLHDMGPGLDAGLDDGPANAREWRTPPLWGLRWRPRLLHDERASAPMAAIAAHGAEAAGASKRFFALTERQRAAVLAFLGSL